LFRANIIKIALLLIIATIFSAAPLYAESKTLQLNSRHQKSISRSSRGNNFNVIPSLTAPATRIAPAKSFAPLVPKIKVSAPTIKTIAPSFPKLNNRITVIPIAKINNFKTAVPLVPKLNSFTPKALKTNPNLAVPKTTIPLVPIIKVTSGKINTLTPALKQPVALNLKQARALKLIPKQNYSARLPMRGPAIPPLVPSRERQPVLPVAPSIPNNPISQPTGSNTGNTNSNNSGHHHGVLDGPFSAPLILGLFGHFPVSSKRRISQIISEISRRLKNGIGVIFGARSPNISQMDGCLLAYVHQGKREAKSGYKLGWSQENCGLFCFIEDKKAAVNQPEVKIEALNRRNERAKWAYL